MKCKCWETRATDSIIKSGQKGTEASIPNVVQLKFSLHLTTIHMSLFSDRLIIFHADLSFKEIRHFETTE